MQSWPARAIFTGLPVITPWGYCSCAAPFFYSCCRLGPGPPVDPDLAGSNYMRAISTGALPANTAHDTKYPNDLAQLFRYYLFQLYCYLAERWP